MFVRLFAVRRCYVLLEYQPWTRIMPRFIKGAFIGAVIGYGIWRFVYPFMPMACWVVGGALALGTLYAWFGHRLLAAILDWLWFRSRCFPCSLRFFRSPPA